MSSSANEQQWPAAGIPLSADRFVRLHEKGAAWRVRTNWQTDLFGNAAPDWFALDRDTRAEPIKRGHERQTWRVTLPIGTVFAKVVEPAGPVERWKANLRLDACAREWRVAREAEARGIPVPRCLAVGMSNGPLPRRILLSAGVPGAVGLAEAWERDVESTPAPSRRASARVLADAVARLFATAHERGFVHGDAHPNNILTVSGGSPGASAAFVDVHSARLTRGPVSLRHAANSLAQVDQYFHRRATRTERLRFLNAYLDSRPSMASPANDRESKRRFLSLILRASAAQSRRLTRHWDRRLRGHGKYFATLDLGSGWRATVVLTVERRHVFAEPAVPDRTVADWQAILHRLIERIDSGPPIDGALQHEGLRVETRVIRRRVDRWLTMLRRPAHRREFERCHRLRHRGIDADLVVAYAEHRRAGLIDTTLIVRAGRDRASP